jgi:Uncharacterized paraquat-inducible protein A
MKYVTAKRAGGRLSCVRTRRAANPLRHAAALRTLRRSPPLAPPRQPDAHLGTADCRGLAVYSANLLPVMHTSSLLGSEDDTIMSGVVYFWTSGDWPWP